MNKENLKGLTETSNAEQLQRAIEALCLPFGNVKDIRLLRINHGMEYVCFVELDSPDQYPHMVAQLGGIDYGHCVVFRIPIDQSND